MEIDENSEMAINTYTKIPSPLRFKCRTLKKGLNNSRWSANIKWPRPWDHFCKASFIDFRSQDLRRLDLDVRHCYRDKDFKFEAADKRKLRRQEQVNNPKYMENPLKCRHRLRVPAFTVVSCSHCGKQHKDPQDWDSSLPQRIKPFWKWSENFGAVSMCLLQFN